MVRLHKPMGKVTMAISIFYLQHLVSMTTCVMECHAPAQYDSKHLDYFSGQRPEIVTGVLEFKRRSQNKDSLVCFRPFKQPKLISEPLIFLNPFQNFHYVK